MKNSDENVWDREAESYKAEADTSPDYQAHFRQVAKALGPNLKNKKILEVGSGTGITSAYLASRGACLYLADISPKALAFEKKYFASKKLKANFFRQSAFNLKFRSGYFDAVWSGGVIEHFQDKEKIIFIKNMWRLVKPGGKMLVVVPNSHDLAFMAAKKILELRGKWAFGYEDDMTAGRLRRLADAAGVPCTRILIHNPVVGWWFFPYGREITDRLGLNTVKEHESESAFGHNLMLISRKPMW